MAIEYAYRNLNMRIQYTCIFEYFIQNYIELLLMFLVSFFVLFLHTVCNFNFYLFSHCCACVCESVCVYERAKINKLS